MFRVSSFKLSGAAHKPMNSRVSFLIFLRERIRAPVRRISLILKQGFSAAGAAWANIGKKKTARKTKRYFFMAVYPFLDLPARPLRNSFECRLERIFLPV